MFDFDKETDRRNTGSLKWDVKENELPMWVADMDFETAPAVINAIKARAEHGIFGYSVLPDKWYDAYIGWWKTRHGFSIDKDWLIFCTGVIPAISSIVRKLTTPAEKVVLMTPVYNIFFNSVLNNGRVVLECPLDYSDGSYSIDYKALEKCLSDPQTSLMILCNPHNPIGKIWDAETLRRVADMCKKYSVTVISDEIHCDLTDPGCEYIPFASVSDTARLNSITCAAPTKSFNIAGLQTAAVIVPDPVLRHKVWRSLNTDEVAEPNVFAVDAVVAAYDEGAEWFDALRGYIYDNKKYAEEILDSFQKIRLVKSQATYLLWLDCTAMPLKGDALAEDLRNKTGLYLSSGSAYKGNGAGFLRMNIACPRSRLIDGLERLGRYSESCGS